MLWLSLGFFGFVFALMAFDAWRFHRSRQLDPRERWAHPLDNALWVGVFSYVWFIPYSELSRLGFGALAVLIIVSRIKGDFWHAKRCSGPELVLHAGLLFLLPLALGLIAADWFFIDGASLLLGMLLPFSTWGLRWFLGGCAVVSLALVVLQLITLKTRAAVAAVGTEPLATTPMTPPAPAISPAAIPAANVTPPAGSPPA